jgi:hypothetical protein
MKKTVAVAALLGIAATIAFGATPAFAADAPTLPAGQALYNIDCEDNGPQLWTFTTDGASTPVGSPVEAGSCAGGGQTSPVDGKTYFINYPGGPVSALATVDLATGEVTTIAAINGAVNDAWQLVITNDGTAYISQGQNLYAIDLATAATTLVGSMAPFNPGAMGYDYLTDTIYGFSGGNVMKVYTIDRTTGAPTDTGIGGNWPVATCLGGGPGLASPDGVAFDSNGIAWIQADSACNSLVMAVNTAGGASWITGELFDSTATLYGVAPFTYYSETFLIAPLAAAKPALASTGTNLGAVSLVGITAAIAALLGVVLLTSRRQRKA